MSSASGCGARRSSTPLPIVGELPAPVAGLGGGGNRIAGSAFPPAAAWSPASFDTEIGAGGGGGSGGMILLQARRVDLRLASPNAITALGGRGGRGANNVYGATCAGGNGGPGIVQIHVPNESTNLVLPIGATLPQLTAPTAYVLNTVPGL